MKKFLCSVIALTMSLSICACSSGEKKANKGDVTEIMLWSAGAGSKEYDTKQIEEFNKTVGKDINVKINYELVTDTKSRLDVAFTTNDEPEIFGGYPMDVAAENGYIIAYEDIEGGKEFLNKFNKSDFYDTKNTYGGKTYCVPQGCTLQGLFYNKDLFKKAGIVDENGEAKPPETLAEFREDAKKISDLGKDIYGVIYSMKWDYWYEYTIDWTATTETGYLDFDYATGKTDSSGKVPRMQAVVDTINDKSAYPGAETLDNDPARARFAEGNIGMIFGQQWDCEVYNTQFPAKFDWGVAPVPTESKENRFTQQKMQEASVELGRKLKEKLSDSQIMAIAEAFFGDNAIQKKYESGIAMPWKEEIIDKADSSNLPNGWADFGQILKISQQRPTTPKSDMSGEKSLKERFYSEVLHGNKTSAQITEEYDQALTKGIERYLEVHPEDKIENYIHTDLDFRRK